MNTTTMEPPVEAAITDIVAVVADNPGIVLLDSAKFDAFYERMKAETDKLVPDTSTEKGRDLIRSMAARVTRTKTRIEEARLGLTEEWRKNTKMANDAGKAIKERLEGLAAEVRAPLTEWEEIEKARISDCRADIDWFKHAKIIAEDDTADSVRERGTQVYHHVLDPEGFGDMLEEAQAAKDDAIATLKRALDRLTKEEADRAELERLRAAEAERAERERVAAEEAEAARIEAERIEKERLAAERAEEERKAAEAREAIRIDQARKDAAEAAQRATEEAARKAQEERDAAHAAEIARLQKERDDAEAARQAEEDRKAEAQRRADAEQAKREANIKHRTAVKKKAKGAIMRCGATEEVAVAIVTAIVSGEVPAVALSF